MTTIVKLQTKQVIPKKHNKETDMATNKKPTKKPVASRATSKTSSSRVAPRKTASRSTPPKSSSIVASKKGSFFSKRRGIVLVVVLVVFGGIGTYLLQQSQAATYSNYGCTTYPTLRKGSKGNCVKKLQNTLQKKWGYNTGGVDGNFGTKTDASVRAFQKKKGLKVDGVVGSATWRVVRQGVTYVSTARPVGSGSSNPSGGGGYGQPLSSVNTTITRCVGVYKHPIGGDMRRHSGIDMGASTGTTIRAVKGGKVVASTYGGSAGNYVRIDHGSTTSTSMHMSKRSVSTGQTVTKGQKIGEVGSTGGSTSPHLHLSMTGVSVTNGWYDVIPKSGYRVACKAGSQP